MQTQLGDWVSFGGTFFASCDSVSPRRSRHDKVAFAVHATLSANGLRLLAVGDAETDAPGAWHGSLWLLPRRTNNAVSACMRTITCWYHDSTGQQ